MIHSSISVSVHENCAFMGNDRYHVRVRAKSAQIREVLEAYVRYGWDHEGDYEARHASFVLGGKRFDIDMGEYDSRGIEDCRSIEGIVYFTVSTGSLYLQFSPFIKDGETWWNIDMSPESPARISIGQTALGIAARSRCRWTSGLSPLQPSAPS